MRLVLSLHRRAFDAHEMLATIHPAMPHHVVEADKVARLFSVYLDNVGAVLSLEPVHVNGSPALIMRLNGETTAFWRCGSINGLVTGLYPVRIPEKLSRVQRETLSAAEQRLSAPRDVQLLAGPDHLIVTSNRPFGAGRGLRGRHRRRHHVMRFRSAGDPAVVTDGDLGRREPLADVRAVCRACRPRSAGRLARACLLLPPPTPGGPPDPEPQWGPASGGR